MNAPCAAGSAKPSADATQAVRNFLFFLSPHRVKSGFPLNWSEPIMNLVFCFFIQVYLAFGLAGMVWPERFMPLFGVLMFPWAASHKLIRANGLAAIAAYLLLVARIWMVGL
jgi:hypothetical protein